jgi:hypothetical protein
MSKVRLNLRNVVAIAICLAGFTIFCGCEKENEPSIDNQNNSSNSLKVGQSYQGGIIAYIDATGKHGLIAAPQDQSNGIQWSNGESFLVTTETAIGTGKNNTARIVQMQGNGAYAAKLCADLVLNGYSDWFLPSTDELNMLYQNRLEIGKFNFSSTY